MHRYSLKNLALLAVLLVTPLIGKAQNNSYSLETCIQTAWKNSTDISRSELSLSSEQSSLEQSKAARNPNLILQGSGNVSSGNSYDEVTTEWDRSINSSASLQLSSSLTIYNGAKLRNAILKDEVDIKAADSDIQTQKEILALNILTAYMNVLYAEEQAKNSKAQLASTTEQLNYTKERKSAGVIAQSEYLNMQSQYATDEASYISSQSQVRILKVNLMQLMNIPINDLIEIESPELDELLMHQNTMTASDIYLKALELQPSIQTASLDLESAAYDIKMAKAGSLPEITMNGSLGTNYNQGLQSLNFGSQMANQVTPSLGISVSVPIYQRKVVKNNVTQASIQQQSIALQLTDIKNSLRQSIEQTYTDALVANADYKAAIDQYNAQQESLNMADEMFKQGLINATEYLVIRNNFVAAENSVTQSKFQVILQNEYLRYYNGQWIIGQLK